MKIHCLDVDVYRNDTFGDCTNGGVSSRFNRLLVACPNGPITFDGEKEVPLNFCIIEKRNLFGGTLPDVRIIPATVDESGQIVKRPGWWMYGGNIAACADSRFSEMNGHYYPLKIHDRQER